MLNAAFFVRTNYAKCTLTTYFSMDYLYEIKRTSFLNVTLYFCAIINLERLLKERPTTKTHPVHLARSALFAR